MDKIPINTRYDAPTDSGNNPHHTGRGSNSDQQYQHSQHQQQQQSSYMSSSASILAAGAAMFPHNQSMYTGLSAMDHYAAQHLYQPYPFSNLWGGAPPPQSSFINHPPSMTSSSCSGLQNDLPVSTSTSCPNPANLTVTSLKKEQKHFLDDFSPNTPSLEVNSPPDRDYKILTEKFSTPYFATEDSNSSPISKKDIKDVTVPLQHEHANNCENNQSENNPHEQIEETSTSESYCFICNEKINSSTDSFRHIYNDFTTTSFIQVSEVISQIMKDSSDAEFIEMRKSSHICINCFTVIDKIDELQELLKVRNLIFFYKYKNLRSLKNN